MRKEKVWVIAHPEEQRFFVQPHPVTMSRGRYLREQGYMIFVTEVTFPPAFDASALPIESTCLTEQWPKDDASES